MSVVQILPTLAVRLRVTIGENDDKWTSRNRKEIQRVFAQKQVPVYKTYNLSYLFDDFSARKNLQKHTKFHAYPVNETDMSRI